MKLKHDPDTVAVRDALNHYRQLAAMYRYGGMGDRAAAAVVAIETFERLVHRFENCVPVEQPSLFDARMQHDEVSVGG